MHGHLGVDKTLAAMQQLFYWPNMVDDVRLYIKTCERCQKNKPSNLKKAGLLTPLPIADNPFESVSLDFITELPETQRGHDALLVVVDRLSRLTTLIPSAAEAAALFYENVFVHFGMPTSIISDRDPLRRQILADAVAHHGNHAADVNSIPPADGWLDGESQPCGADSTQLRE